MIRFHFSALAGAALLLSGCNPEEPAPLTPVPLDLATDTPTEQVEDSPTPGDETATPTEPGASHTEPPNTPTATPTPTAVPEPTEPPVDEDGDGHFSDVDCDDNNENIHPDALEICSGPEDTPTDEDCDGAVDENVGAAYYPDTDGDGYGDPSGVTRACAQPEGYTTQGSDCDDQNASLNPETLWYPDADTDGFGDGDGSTLSACEQPQGYVLDTRDCDDSRSDVSPAGQEVCDDAGTDEDCDGLEGDADSSLDVNSTVTSYPDSDSDGYGTNDSSHQSCVPPDSYVLESGDCAPENSGIFPTQVEVCDGVDQDCDLEVDEGIVGSTHYIDDDGDGFGDSSNTVEACLLYAGISESGDDCDDSNSAIYPGAEEVCDGLDNDCDDAADEGLETAEFFPDLDSDGVGTMACSVMACAAPEGYVTSNDDCDGLNPGTYPGAQELCDGQDNDCDGLFDEGFSKDDSGSRVYWHADLDGDGFGSITNVSCTKRSGDVDTRGDCDDDNAAVYPGASDDSGDSIDGDCGGTDGPDVHVGLNNDSAPNLEDAVSDALACQTIWVGPGDYALDSALTLANVTLRSLAYPEETTLVGDSSDRLIVIAEGAATLDGFSLTGGAAPNTGSFKLSGGLIEIEGGSPIIQNSTLIDGVAQSYGGAVAVFGGSPTFVGLSVEANTALAGGGAFYLQNTAAGFQGVHLKNNETDNDGAGIYIFSAIVTIADSLIEGGTATTGGGISIQGGSLSLENTNIVDNDAHICGGMYINAGQFQYDGGVIEGNQTDQGLGGGLCALGGQFSLSALSFIDNHSSANGGGLYLQWPATMDGTGLIFDGNTADEDGGGLFADDGSLTLEGAVFESNSAQGKGGGFYAGTLVGSLSVARFTKNDATWGGGVALMDSTYPLRSVLVEENEAEQQGGGIYAARGVSTSVSQMTVIKNEAAIGAGFIGGGSGSTLTFSNSIFAFNEGRNIHLLDQDQSTIRMTFNDIYSSGGADSHNISNLGSTNVEVDPMFLETPNGNHRWDVHLSLSSPLIDHGDSTQADPDGSRSDMGIYGGERADDRDLDLDSVPDYFWPGDHLSAPSPYDPSLFDCDDRDGDVVDCS